MLEKVYFSKFSLWAVLLYDGHCHFNKTFMLAGECGFLLKHDFRALRVDKYK